MVIYLVFFKFNNLYWIGLNSGADKMTVLVSLIATLIYLSLFQDFWFFGVFFIKKTKAFF